MDKADMAVGSKVRHPWHGIGTVTSLGGDSRMAPVVVDFAAYRSVNVAPELLDAEHSADMLAGEL